MSQPMFRAEEVSDGINVIIDNRWAALLPMESKAQIDLLVEVANKAVEQKLRHKD